MLPGGSPRGAGWIPKAGKRVQKHSHGHQEVAARLGHIRGAPIMKMRL